jgi:hypothetical protein
MIDNMTLIFYDLYTLIVIWELPISSSVNFK